jgi:hypothetical protein
MQLVGPYFLGGSDSKRLEHFGQDGSPVDPYFLLDTRTGKRTDFKTYDELRQAAQHLRVQPSLVPIGSLYSKYRFTWFDAFAGILLIAPPLVCAGLLMRWLMRVRRTRLAPT